MAFCKFLSVYLLSGPKAEVKARVKARIEIFTKTKVEPQETISVESGILLTLIKAQSVLWRICGLAI